MFLVEAYAISHLTFRGCRLLVQAMTVEFASDLGYCFLRDLMRGYPNTPMTGLIVRMDQRLQHVHVP